MYNPTQTLPSETWTIILEQCDPYKDLVVLSMVNKKLNTLVMPIFKTMKINMEVLCDLFCEIQYTYTVKYQTVAGPGDLKFKMEKNIVVNLTIKNKLIFFDGPEKNENNPLNLRSIDFQTFADNALMNLNDNQILISPSFGPMESGKYLLEDNPNHHLVGLRLGSPNSIAQDRLPVEKITIKSNKMKPALLFAIKLAEKKANEHFFKLNGSCTKAIENIPPHSFSFAEVIVNQLFSFLNSK